MKIVTISSKARYTRLSLHIKHILLLAMTSLLLMLTLVAQAESAIPSLIFGTTANGLRDVSKQDIEVAFNNGITAYNVQYNINTKIKVFDSKQELIAAFDQGKIDGIFGMPTLVLARMDQLKDTMVACVYLNDLYKFRYLLLVRKADNISSIEQLHAKRISLAKPFEVEALFLNTLLLRQKQLEAPQFFSEVIDAASSNVAISDVFFGRADAAILNENEYKTALELNPQIGQKTMILDQSEPMVLFVAVLRKSMSEELQERAYRAELDFQQSDVGRNAFKLVGMKGFKRIMLQELDSLRALKDEYDQLKSASSFKTEQKSGANIKPNSKFDQVPTASDKAQRNKKPRGYSKR